MRKEAPLATTKSHGKEYLEMFSQGLFSHERAPLICQITPLITHHHFYRFVIYL
jgi:hypothetical protein